MVVFVTSTMRTLGIAGMCVNGLFLLICCWRMARVLQVKNEWRDNRARLHVAVLLFAIFEFLYQVSIFVTESYSIWGYLFHILALTLYIVSFCLIFIRWERTLGLARSETIKVGRVAGSLVLVNAIFNFIFIVLILVDKDIIFGNGKMWPLKFTRDIVECFSLLFSTVWLFSYSVHLNDRLSRVLDTTTKASGASFSANKSKQNSVRRIVIVLFFCSLCYILRLVCLLLLAIDTATGSNRASRFDNIGWFLLSNWVPTLVPGLLFLYTSRMIKVEEIKNANALQSMFKEDLASEYSVEESETASNPVHSTNHPSVNIDGIDRPSEDFLADMRSRASVESLPPGHQYEREGENGYDEAEDGDISLTPSFAAPRASNFPLVDC